MTERAFGIRGNLPPEFAAEVARAAEANGYQAFWITAGLGEPNLAPLAAAAQATTTITVGVGAIPLSHCTADDVVAEVLRWDLPQSRLLLGVGSGFPPISLAAFDEHIRQLKATLACRVVVGAMGPRTCALAGKSADGILLTLVTPEHARRSMVWADAGVPQDGQGGFHSYAYLSTAVGEDSTQELIEEAGTFAQYPAFVRHFERLGSAPETAGIAVQSLDGLSGALQSWDGVVDQVVVRTTRHANSLAQTLALLEAAAPQ
jgi:alkanesulfonate monooxygenase SsuD/methylene tetrahydromethanopterin reductase-like flavin-dependent oxidoreductase (luciferase family)